MDPAYLSRANCDAVVAMGARSWFKIESNTTAKKMGSQAWHVMVDAWRRHPRIAKDRYHRRSKIESASSTKKRKLGGSARRRLPVAQRTDEAYSWVGCSFPLAPRALYEFEVKLPIV